MSVGILLNHARGVSSSKMIFPGSNPVLKVGVNNGSYSITDSEYYVKVNQASTAENSPILSLKMDVTKYNVLRITSKRQHAWNYTWVGYWLLSEANWKSGSNVGLPSSYLNNGANKSKCSMFAQWNTGGAYNVTATIDYDISALTGIYYLDIGTRTSSDNQDKREAIMRIYNVELLNYTDDEFQEVEYIESTGTQHIDTGYVPNNNTRTVCDIMWTQFNNSYWGGFGAGASSTSRAFECYVYSSYVNWNFYNHSYGADGSLGYRGSTNTRYHIDANKSVFTIYNSSGTQLKQITAQDGTFTAPYTMYLFGLHRSSSGHGYVRFYGHVYIYDNGTLIREFVPCYRKSDGVIGMWDKVNKQFYTNGGTGTFTKGGDVT